MSNIIRKFLFKYALQQWNIAIANIGDDLTPTHIQWMKHSYKDRWFADPFIIDETDDAYIVLVEEFLRDTRCGRLARLTLNKKDCCLLQNETILDIATHLSFPNPITVDGKQYIYPENGAAGNTSYYEYGEKLNLCGELSSLPLADAVIYRNGDGYYLFATLGEKSNGNELMVYSSTRAFSGYHHTQTIQFPDNTARRAGNVFQWKDKLISPAQVCNNDYGEGVSLQELTIFDGKVELKEIKRIKPLTKDYPNGFHTYNVFKDKVVIDGYRYWSLWIHKLYFKMRGIS